MNIRRKKRLLDFCGVEFILELREYYRKRDLDDGSNWMKIFDELYISRERLCYDKIMYKHGISESSLKRFIARANALAEKLLSIK
jgi:hypothetical protein